MGNCPDMVILNGMPLSRTIRGQYNELVPLAQLPIGAYLSMSFSTTRFAPNPLAQAEAFPLDPANLLD